MYGKQQNSNGEINALYSNVWNSTPTTPVVMYEDGVFGRPPTDEFNNKNGFAVLNSSGTSISNRLHIATDFALDQKLDFITEGLSLKGKVSLSTYYKNRTLYADFGFPEYLLDYSKIGGVDSNKDGIPDNPWSRNGQGNAVYNMAPVDLNVGGLEGGYYTNLYYEMSLNYNKSFGNHNVSALALINRQQKNQAASARQ